jgi:hypothetical protein
MVPNLAEQDEHKKEGKLMGLPNQEHLLGIVFIWLLNLKHGVH